MEAEQAQKLLLPNADAFQALALTLDEAKLSAIAKASDARVPKNFSPKIWRAMQTDKPVGWVIADRVIGKYDLIDYAAGFDAQGASLGMEVLAYRESHGSEIKQTAWRKQFIGKKGPDTMRFADDIRNISGATLSCQHVTEGMQRLSALVSLLVAGK
jgi:Na+-translocating ferredoxin:NAD+ oxidoreductase RnfG subunit